MRNLLLFILLTLSPVLLASQVSITGNERTKESFIRKTLDLCFDSINGVAPDAVQECLVNTKLFSEVTVVQEDSNYRITVKERWTLIPIPNYQKSETDQRYGVIFLESNLLGYGHKIIAAAFTGDRSQAGFFNLNLQNVFGSSLAIVATGVASNEEYRLIDGEKTLYKMREKRGIASVSTGFIFNQNSRLLAGISTSARSYDQVDSFPTPNRYNYRAATFGGVLGKKSFRLFYDEGWETKFRFSRQIERSDQGELENEIDANFAYGRGLWEENLALTLSLGYKSTSGRDRLRSHFFVGNTNGYRGIPKNGIWARKAQTATVALLCPVWPSTRGTVVAGTFFDTGRLEYSLLKDKPVVYKSYGAGFYYFLKRVAVPGIGLEFGTNPDFGGAFTKFSIGGSL